MIAVKTLPKHLEDLLGRLNKVKPTADKRWMALCPAHADTEPSLQITLGEDGKTILLHCFAGCKMDNICRALHISVKDLFADSKAGNNEPEAVYDYVDEFGKLLFQVCRFRGKRFSQRVPTGNGQYRWSLNGVRRVPYNLEEITRAKLDTQIFIPEGEKDCNRLGEIGLLATTDPGGAGKWRKDYNGFFTGRPVVLLPDNDHVGREHAKQIVEQLLPVAREVKLVMLDDLPAGGDVSDWLDTGGTRDGLMLRVNQSKPLARTNQATVIIRKLAEVTMRDVDWLWPNRFPMGKLSLIVGDPSLGKSFLTLYMASRVSNGLPWPDGCGNAPLGNVVLLSAEDDLEDTVVPRLKDHGADLKRIVAIEGITKQDRKFYFNLAKDLPALERTIEQTQNVQLVVIDPITAYCGFVDSHKNAEVRGLLAPLAQLAAKHRVAVVGVSHLRKGEGKALYRVLGSLAFIAAARAVWVVSKDENDHARRLLTPAKCNLATNASGLAFRIIDGQVWFDEGSVSMSADEALKESNDDDRTALEEATDWLKQALSDGEMKASNIYQLAAENEIAKRTLQRAVKVLAIQKRKHGSFEKLYWMWSLPEDGQ